MTRPGMLLLGVAVMVSCGLIGSPYAAAQDSTEPIALAWDGGTTGLTWHPGSAATAIGSFVGSAVIVPGDSNERTINVRNDGPSAATATVQIVNVTSSGTSASVNHELDSLVHLTWRANQESHDVTWRQAVQAGEPAWTTQFPVAQGQVFQVTAGYYFPSDSTGGRAQGRGSYALGFDVRITLTGDTPPSKPSSPPQGSGSGGPQIGSGGAAISAPSGWVPVVAAAAGLSLALVWRRRRAADDSGTHSAKPTRRPE